MKISKKVWLSALAGIVLASGVSAQSITLTNIFGGDADNLYSKDFITLTKDDDGLNKENVNISDRLQLDFKGDKILGRVRLEGKINGLDGKNSELRLRGFVGLVLRDRIPVDDAYAADVLKKKPQALFRIVDSVLRA